MVSALGHQRGDRWLEPCVGQGVFLEALQSRGVPPARITAIDIDPTPRPVDVLATTVRGVDFFKWQQEQGDCFTKIVANPPYLAHNRLPRSLLSTVVALRGLDSESFRLGSNYWCSFLAASLRLLRQGGSLSFVLPAAWDYAEYGSSIRNTINASFKSLEVHRCAKPLFTEVQEGCVVIVARGHGLRHQSSIRMDHASPRELLRALSRPAELADGHGAARVTRPTREFAGGVRLDELFSVRIGCVTGDSKYFLLTESQRIEYGLPESALRPILSRARHLSAGHMRKSDWASLRSLNERVWLFAPESTSLKNRAVRRYLARGEQICKLDGYKIANRERWFEVPVDDAPDGFISGMSKHGPWICWRAMRSLIASNTLYTITCKQRLSNDERAAWALALMTRGTQDVLARLGRRYPDGLIKYEPKDLHSVILRTPIRVEGAMSVYEEVVRRILSEDLAAGIRLADHFIDCAGRCLCGSSGRSGSVRSTDRVTAQVRRKLLRNSHAN